jgi:hypothetical protein
MGNGRRIEKIKARNGTIITVIRGTGEVGKWGSGGISTKTLKP